jgi:hypothetical protein
VSFILTLASKWGCDMFNSNTCSNLKSLNFKNEYPTFKAMLKTKKQSLDEFKQPKPNESTPTQKVRSHSPHFIVYHGF